MPHAELLYLGGGRKPNIDSVLCMSNSKSRASGYCFSLFCFRLFWESLGLNQMRRDIDEKEQGRGKTLVKTKAAVF